MVKKILVLCSMVMPLYLIIVTFSFHAMNPNADAKKKCKRKMSAGKTSQNSVAGEVASPAPKTTCKMVKTLLEKHMEDIQNQAGILRQAENSIEDIGRELYALHDDAAQLEQRIHEALRHAEMHAEIRAEIYGYGDMSQSIEQVYRREIYYLSGSHSIVAKSHDDQPGSSGHVITIIKNLMDGSFLVCMGHATENNAARVEGLKKLIEEFHAQLF